MEKMSDERRRALARQGLRYADRRKHRSDGRKRSYNFITDLGGSQSEADALVARHIAAQASGKRDFVASQYVAAQERLKAEYANGGSESDDDFAELVFTPVPKIISKPVPATTVAQHFGAS